MTQRMRNRTFDSKRYRKIGKGGLIIFMLGSVVGAEAPKAPFGSATVICVNEQRKLYGATQGLGLNFALVPYNHMDEQRKLCGATQELLV